MASFPRRVPPHLGAYVPPEGSFVSSFKEGVRGVLVAAGVLGPPAGIVDPRPAAGMSAVLACAALFTVFLTGWASEEIGADPWAFAYACAVFLDGEFFTGLVAILGLAAYARRQGSESLRALVDSPDAFDISRQPSH